MIGQNIASIGKYCNFILADTLEYKEVMMQGGGVHTVPITIAKCGTAIVWEFNTEPKGIAFGITYKPSDESGREDDVRTGDGDYNYCTPVLSTCKVHCVLQCVIRVPVTLFKSIITLLLYCVK